MATIVLQAAGAFLGAALGPLGGVIGGAIGAVAGYWVDQTLIKGTQTIEGQRLSGQRPFGAEEGIPLPRVYGVVRQGGGMIWATRFEEEKRTTRRGAKGGGAKVTEYNYFANVAFALCEGEIAGVRRIWADGREVDQDEIQMRVYTGSETQQPDPLIEAKQGAGNAPAYRGTAYVVFERLALANYGNRIPQLQFEVLRPINAVTERVRAVCMIPGSTEYGLGATLVTKTLSEGETVAVNRNVLTAPTDFLASVDELQSVFPNLEHVALVVTWFGNDLRCGHCTVRPCVVDNLETRFSEAWVASGVPRIDAPEVSLHGGSAAYGGSPSDKTVVEAITELRARGLKVTLYPLIMMDVPSGNALPDPYGGIGQPPYPWRGRVTAQPAAGQPGTADKTAAARTQIEVFCGEALPAHFVPAGDSVDFTGPADDWGYRRFILHFATLAEMAGGVDAFLLGAELRGLTGLRDAAGAFPFVEALCELATQVRSILRPATKITYAADWSEYFGHQPPDGSGDVCFHLDALWAHPAIDAVGIDNYMPLSDWRDADYRGGNPDGFRTPYELSGLRAAIASGEGYDWHYASLADRNARNRTQITDGAYGKPWVFRHKDLVSWWSNQHFDRNGGVESGSPTAWQPRSKPIWFTELGCPAIDKGPNQPNVFADPKSAENAVPYFSNGGRSDLAPMRFLEAHLTHWDPTSDAFSNADNPVSPVYDGRMVDHERIWIWSWDARPFPAFPLRTEEWSDGNNWQVGHWLNGRAAGSPVGEVINAILADHGLPAADVAQTGGSVTGYSVDEPTTARAALEPIVDLFGLNVRDEPDGLIVTDAGARDAAPAVVTDLVWDGKAPVIATTRGGVDDLPVDCTLGFRDPMREFQAGSVAAHRLGATGKRKATTTFPGTMEAGQAQALLDEWLQRQWFERESVSFAVLASAPGIIPGAVVSLPDIDAELLVTDTEDGLATRVTARKVSSGPSAIWQARAAPAERYRPTFAGRPFPVVLDLPLAPGQTAVHDQMRIAIRQKPWRPQAVFSSPAASGYVQRGLVSREATIGRLTHALSAGVEGRLDHSRTIEIALLVGEMASVSRIHFLNGANAAAIRSASGSWEVIQFEAAEETAPDLWLLSGLLRAQLGTDDAMLAGAPAGALFVLLDEAVPSIGLRPSEVGLSLNWRVGPTGVAFVDTHFVTLAETGGVRARLPLSPVHLRGQLTSDGDLEISWIRRSRIDADDWEGADIPLGEEMESYQIEIRSIADDLKRTAAATEQSWIYTNAAIIADFGLMPPQIDVAVRQIGTDGPGIARTRRMNLS
jgi:hypothetical protein